MPKKKPTPTKPNPSAKPRMVAHVATPAGSVPSGLIQIRGARVHNLKNLDVDIPRDQLTVITGVSGSGKSSLAFDTLFAEGQRQYVDSLGPYARQFLEQVPRPDVDSIVGLAPTLAINQSLGSSQVRSTVATVTEIYDYLRLLYARVGTAYCVNCQLPVSPQSPESICDSLALLAENTRLVLLAPLVRGRKGTHREVFEQIQKAGLVRVRVDGELLALEDVPDLAPRKTHMIEAVIDRIVIREGVRDRLTEAIHLGLRLSGGSLISLVETTGGMYEERIHSTSHACLKCGTSIAELEPRSFSFNSPYGACPQCEGLGYTGDGSATKLCHACGGGRLKPESLAVRIASKAIHELTSLDVRNAASWFSKFNEEFDELQRAVALPIQTEVQKRLRFLEQVGVEYLTLDRTADSLSGGELQRVRLATSLGSALVGVCYVLDEPSIGLHPADHDRLIATIRSLREQGNTIVIVEHDEATMREADCLIDIGPEAGKQGGRLVSHGTPQEVAADLASLTGDYLAGRKRIPMPKSRRQPLQDRWLVLEGVTMHNLKNVTARFPLGLLIGVSGVSGSGKSSLINDTLYPALAQKLGLVAPSPGAYCRLLGFESIDKLVPIDQSPIGRSSRSCPATYAGVLDEIRKVYASTREAKTLGYSATRFSFNSPAGRCDQCKGYGVETIEMNFLSNLTVLCSRCNGKRFNRQTLQVRFKGASIADVLDLTIEAAVEFFENVPRVKHLLQSLVTVGLGYLHLGQSSTTLSGGEAQRLKLAAELARVATGNTLYILDEPTTGLHFADIARLLNVLQQLVDSGNTVIVIEHQFDLLAACDWLIDLGPGGGQHGGEIIASGTPESVASMDHLATARYLSRILAAHSPDH